MKYDELLKFLCGLRVDQTLNFIQRFDDYHYKKHLVWKLWYDPANTVYNGNPKTFDLMEILRGLLPLDMKRHLLAINNGSIIKENLNQ